MQRATRVGILAALTLVAGCGADSEAPASTPVLTAATLGEQTLRTPAEYLASAPYVTADRANGEALARRCRACHTLERDGVNRLGPRLHGFFGQPVGSVEGFAYTNAVLAAEFAWTPRALDAWLQHPSRFLPGNMMAFAGVPDAADRADLIAYLLAVTNTESESSD